MTGSQMLSTLGLRMNDPDASRFTNSARLDALNIAQKTVVNLVNNAYLTELQSVETSAMTSGYLAFSSSFNPIRNGVVAVKVTGGKWATRIEPGDQKRLENSYLSASSDNPVSYVFQERVYVEGTSATTDSIDVWYLKSPISLSNDSTECELNEALHELVVDFAESQLWKMAGRLDQAQSAQANALAQVEALNSRYEAERPQGIGV